VPSITAVLFDDCFRVSVDIWGRPAGADNEHLRRDYYSVVNLGRITSAVLVRAQRNYTRRIIP